MKDVRSISVGANLLRHDFVLLLLKRMKEILIDAEELGQYSDKVNGFDPFTHMPVKVSLLEESEYDREFRRIEYSGGSRHSSATHGSETDGQIFTIVNNVKGTRIRIILLRKPFDLAILVRELLHIFEEYLNLPFGELSRYSQSVADHANIKVQPSTR